MAKLEESLVDFHINEDLLKETNKDEMKHSLDNSQHDSIIDLKHIKKAKENEKKSAPKLNLKTQNLVAKKHKNLNFMKNSQNFQTCSTNQTSGQLNNEKNARVLTIESGASEIKENYMDSGFISGRKGFDNI
jgi:hypothetical protein